MLKKSEQKIIDETAGKILDDLLKPAKIELTAINGNYPGIDGMVQLVGEDKIYSSKYLLYQVKGKAKSKSLSFSCLVTHLRHWAKSNVPVIFVLVDNENKVAYWKHIDKKYVDSLKIKSGQTYKNIQLESEKTINSPDYFSEWRKIAVSDDDVNGDEWNQIINNLENKLILFVGVFYLLGPISDGDSESIGKVKDILSIDNKEFTVLLYEALKRAQIKSVGRILIVADEKLGLTGLSEYVSSLSKKEVNDLPKIAKDEKQRNIMLKRLAEIRDDKSEETLNEIADEFLKDFEKML